VKRDVLFVGVVLGGLAVLLAALPTVDLPAPVVTPVESDPDFPATVGRVDAAFRAQWQSDRIEPAAAAPDLIQARRIALGLMGTVPSLEEIRQFESLPGDQRLPWYLDHVLTDSRYHDHVAERLTRMLVGTEEGPYVFFRRKRLVEWLAAQLAANVPYDRTVRELIAGDGLWTDHPATNFVTVTSRNDPAALTDEDGTAGKVARAADRFGFVGVPAADPDRLARRVARSFLGLRLDCAQCHDHPFAEWTKTDFRGLAAFFGETRIDFAGVHDRPGSASKPVEPRVPFAPELVPAAGTRRERLAAWVTHPDNRAFARATVNRVWALMFGRPLVEPVDNLPAAGPVPPALDVLADDFATHGFDLRRLIRLIASTELFRMDSATDHETGEAEERAWAVFPLTRLRPEQVAGGVLQAASVSTIDAKSHLLARLDHDRQMGRFISRYGDAGEEEFEPRGGTIQQRLLMLNGDLVRNRTRPWVRNAATRIAWLAEDDVKALEAAYLAVLSRRPTPEEAEHFEAALRPGGSRAERLEDVYWALLNSTEFAWNH